MGYKITGSRPKALELERINASSFEIMQNTEESSPDTLGHPHLVGYVGINDSNTKAFEALKELSSRKEVDKLVIVYHDYTFSLMGVSLSKRNDNPPTVTFETTYKFSAKDIQLERLHEG